MLDLIALVMQILAQVFCLMVIWSVVKKNEKLTEEVKSEILYAEICKDIADSEIKAKHEIGQLLVDEQNKVKNLEKENKALSEFCEEQRNLVFEYFNEYENMKVTNEKLQYVSKKDTEECIMLSNVCRKLTTKHKRATKKVQQLVLENRNQKARIESLVHLTLGLQDEICFLTNEQELMSYDPIKIKERQKENERIGIDALLKENEELAERLNNE